MRYDIPLYKPCLHELEREYVVDAFDSGWISSKGKYVQLFEKEFAEKVNRKYALTVCNGTVALHLSLEALKLKKGTAVLCPSLTYVSSANAIRFAGLIPVFVDCDINSGLSTVENFSEGFDYCKNKGLEVSAIMPVHLYGLMEDVDKLIELCKLTNIKIIEDAAESFGSSYGGKICGSNNTDFSCFSFFGNKTITTGEGGMVVCNDEDLYRYAYMLRGVGQKPDAPQRYSHVIVGYNYRMTNLSASIGLAQLRRADMILSKKKGIYQLYHDRLSINKKIRFLKSPDKCIGNNWLITVGLPNNNMREGLMLYLESNKIETRPAFLPMHTMVNLTPFERVNNLKNSEEFGSTFLNLPSFPDMTENEVNLICDSILNFLDIA